MYPLVPVDTLAYGVELVVLFFTAAATLMSFFLTGRATR